MAYTNIWWCTVVFKFRRRNNECSMQTGCSLQPQETHNQRLELDLQIVEDEHRWSAAYTHERHAHINNTAWESLIYWYWLIFLLHVKKKGQCCCWSQLSTFDCPLFAAVELVVRVCYSCSCSLRETDSTEAGDFRNAVQVVMASQMKKST